MRPRNIKRRRQWHPTPVLLPGKSHGWRSLEGCSPWGHWGSDTTERVHFHFSLSCIGEGNGNPLQCSCLENPRDGGAWWAAVYGVAQSQRWLKWLSSSRNIKAHRNSVVGIKLAFLGHEITQLGSGQGVPDKSYSRTLMFSFLCWGWEQSETRIQILRLLLSSWVTLGKSHVPGLQMSF